MSSVYLKQTWSGTPGQTGWHDEPTSVARERMAKEAELYKYRQSLGLPEDRNTMTPEDRFFSAYSKYSGGAGGGSFGAAGGNAPTNEYENKLRSLMSNPNSIADSGAYKFAFNQGQQALERSAAAKGMTGSGNVLAELANYGQGMASQQYDTEANRLASLSSAKDQFQLGRESNALREKATMFDMYNKTPRFVIA